MVEVTIDVKVLGLGPAELAKLFADWDCGRQAEFFREAWHALRESCGGEADRAMQCSFIRKVLDTDGKNLLEELDEPTTQAEDRTHRRSVRTSFIELYTDPSNTFHHYLLNPDTGNVLSLSGQTIGEAIEYRGPGVGLLVRWNTGKEQLLQSRSSLTGWRPPSTLTKISLDYLQNAGRLTIKSGGVNPDKCLGQLGATTMNNQTYEVESVHPDGETVRATGLSEEHLDEFALFLPEEIADRLRKRTFSFSDKMYEASPGTCEECGGKGFVEMFMGDEPCSMCKP